MTIAVTGARGHLGAAIVAELSRDHEVVALQRGDLDITDSRAVEARFARLTPSAIVNCAAYNDVDAAERDPRQALELNACALVGLTRAAERAGAALVHFGTDFVFDGAADRPYRETDAPRPLSAYGCTKLLGERLAEGAPRHYVLRVESIFGGPTAGVTARDGTLGMIARRLKAGDEVPVFTDRVVSPSFAPDIARAVRVLLETSAPSGLYHCVNRGAATWETIARQLASRLGVEPRLKLTTMAAVQMPARRPQYCALDPGKLAAIGVTMPSLDDALQRWLAAR